MEETISLRELFETLKKRLSLIIVITLLAAAISGAMSYFFMKPVYKSSTQILVSQAAAGALASLAGLSFDADAKYIETYNVIMKSPYILDQVIKELDMDTTPEQLNGSVNVAQEGASQVVTISVENHNPAQAVLIANEIAKVFQREISQLMRIDNITILAPAQLAENPVPVKPQPLLNIAIAVVVGLMAGIGLAFFLEYLDNTVKSEQDVETLLGLPVLGAVTKINSTDERNSASSQKKKTKTNRGESLDF
ncbi:YveK family protein [Bacillus sp. V5-8f]|uniref:YveK family protein n=1 Tax=Bacillus sp. V5-8f TaxID=2053044 RepID=UPI000C78BF5B|nr:Wzz/FepE/Etk N-terminal domain-containing protein [Bacillus sp. V5-8f]PLT35765.1 capsular biosynthesis protein [Bacillus sp. V5-8f]